MVEAQNRSESYHITGTDLRSFIGIAGVYQDMAQKLPDKFPAVSVGISIRPAADRGASPKQFTVTVSGDYPDLGFVREDQRVYKYVFEKRLRNPGTLNMNGVKAAARVAVILSAEKRFEQRAQEKISLWEKTKEVIKKPNVAAALVMLGVGVPEYTLLVPRVWDMITHTPPAIFKDLGDYRVQGREDLFAISPKDGSNVTGKMEEVLGLLKEKRCGDIEVQKIETDLLGHSSVKVKISNPICVDP